MPHPRHSNYKGYAITTCSAEIGALPGRLARFDGFFRVDPADRDVESWQQFPRGTFGTREGALANALKAAENSVDLNITASLVWRTSSAAEF